MELNWKQKSAVFMLITPQIALAWLENHNHKNRDKRVGVVKKYASDMEGGRWADNGETIQFDWHGELINGQHRMEAIWASQTAQEMLVVTGLDPAVRPTVDNQSKRRLVDALKGTSFLGHGSVGANTSAGVIPAMKQGMSANKSAMSHPESLAFAEQYADGALFALRQFGQYKRTKVTVAPVIAVVGRAFYHVKDTLMLERFVEVLCTGIQRSPDDRMVIYLREWMINENKTGSRKSSNSNGAYEVYGKTARALEAFLAGQTLSKIYMPREDPFPLPERSGPGAHGSAGRVATDLGQFDARGSGRLALA